ncbi:MAG TPA: hypothetical protein VG755_03560 [Nannocystaceae bacterium]|nr:hypothetical protein [Nannocystaceae bacterium]
MNPLVGCLVADDEMTGDSGNAESGSADSSAGPTTTVATDSTTESADGSSGSDGSSDSSGTADSTGEGPPTMCDPGCADDQLCYAGACTPIGFSVAYGGGTSRQTFWDIAIGPDQNLVAVGNFDEIMQLDAIELQGEGGGLEALVTKLDPTGAPIWAHVYVNEGFAHEIARSVAIDQDGNIFVVGELQETVDFGTGPLESAGDTDVFVLKLDPEGNTLWAQSYGDGDGQHVTAVTTLPDGSVVFTGDFFGTLDLGGDPLVAVGDATDIYVAALDADGAHRWSLSAGDEEYQYAHAITANGGEIMVCGEFRGELDLGGGPLTANLSDLFLAKLDALGAHSWSISNFDDGDDACHAVAMDGGGNVAITGRFVSGLDYGGGEGLPDDSFDSFKYASVFDGDGNHVWSTDFGEGTWAEMGNFTDEIAFDSAGNIVLAGTLTATANFGGEVLPSENVPSIYLAKLDGGGAHQWSTTWPSDNLSQVIYGLAIDELGDIVVSGEFSGDLDLGFGAMSSPTDPDALIARFLP